MLLNGLCKLTVRVKVMCSAGPFWSANTLSLPIDKWTLISYWYQFRISVDIHFRVIRIFQMWMILQFLNKKQGLLLYRIFILYRSASIGRFCLGLRMFVKPSLRLRAKVVWLRSQRIVRSLPFYCWTVHITLEVIWVDWMPHFLLYRHYSTGTILTFWKV
jgi:hypothetical protein